MKVAFSGVHCHSNLRYTASLQKDTPPVSLPPNEGPNEWL